MANPTRFTSGISTAAKNTTLWNFPAEDPTKVYRYFNDFHTYAAADWTITRVGTTPTEALTADEPFGALLLTMAATDNSADQLQLTTENFTITSGKKTWFKSRFKISDATQSDFLVGLAVLDTTLISAGTGSGDDVTDGIFFYKDDGSTSIKLTCQKDVTTGQVSPLTVGTAGTSYMTLGWYFDGGRYIEAYMDGAKVGTLDLGATPSTYLPDTPLTVSVAMMNGEAVAKTMTIDYLFAGIER